MTASRLDLDGVVLWTGDARTILAGMPPASVDCVVTSPLYWRQRDYGVPGQLGPEDTLEAYVAPMSDQLAHVPTPTGTCWLNLGDSYASGPSTPRRNHERLNRHPNCATARQAFGTKRGLQAKNLADVPWRVALELPNGGWLTSHCVGRPAIGIDLNPDFHLIAQQRFTEGSAAEPSESEEGIG